MKESKHTIPFYRRKKNHVIVIYAKLKRQVQILRKYFKVLILPHIALKRNQCAYFMVKKILFNFHFYLQLYYWNSLYKNSFYKSLVAPP
jgi:hypothetical protein